MPRKRDLSRKLLAFARRMRNTPTDAEKKLGSLLRRGQLAGLHFRRQVPVAGYIPDFCCISAGIALEADGGRHNNETGFRKDQKRTQTLFETGIKVLRFSDYEILRHPAEVQETIFRELNQNKNDPPP